MSERVPKLYAEGYRHAIEAADTWICLTINGLQRRKRNALKAEARLCEAHIDLLQKLVNEIRNIKPSAQDRADALKDEGGIE